jgi:hypothetical protein
MVEALVACALVMVPLFLAIPMIAKYQDLKFYTVQSARYAAWERSVWFGGAAAATMGISGSNTFSNAWDANEKSDDAIRKEIGKRILSETGNVKFSSTSDQTSGSFAGGPKRLWKDRKGTALLTSYASISNKADNGKAPGVINDLLTPLFQVTAVVSNFTVDTKAQYTANVDLTVQEVAMNTNQGLGQCSGSSCSASYVVTNNAMKFSQKNVLVANGWSVNGPGSLAEYDKEPHKITTYNQTRGLTPTSLLKPSSGIFKDALDVLKAISTVFFPELSTLDLGRIEVDRVPADRAK